MLRRLPSDDVENVVPLAPDDDAATKEEKKVAAEVGLTSNRHVGEGMPSTTFGILAGGGSGGSGGSSGRRVEDGAKSWPRKVQNFFVTFGKFVGPGFMVF